MNYEQIMEYISQINKPVLGLDNMRNLCEKLNNPQNELSFIHIAGTNGKGSVGAFLQGILTNAGYKVGRYVSPTILSYEERFTINGVNISKNRVSELITQVKEGADKLLKENLPQPTAFEIETAAAFLYFKQEKCDLVLLEVGMGGATDATNIIDKSLISVITSVGFDHTGFLGSTLKEIAEKKAGIIKENSFTVTAIQEKEVIDVISNTAKEKNTQLIVAEPENINYEKNIFDYKDIKNIHLTAMGVYQPFNAAVAIQTALSLNKMGYNINYDNIRQGVENVLWQGRFQILNNNPVFIVDGCHNVDGVKMLVKSLDAYYKNRSLVFIMGVFKDKDYKEMVRLTANKAEKIFTVTPPGDRGLDNKVLKTEIEKYNKNVFACDLKQAVDMALENKNSVCVAFGSLSYIGEIIKMFNA